MADAFRSALWILGLSSPQTVVSPDVTVPAGRRIRVWSFETGDHIADLEGVGADLQIGFDIFGPAAASFTVPYGMITRSLLEPGGVAALVEVDYRELGVPEVWLGAVTGVGVASGRGARRVSLEGPASWLDSESAIVPARERVNAPAGQILGRAVRTHPIDLKVDVPADMGGSAALAGFELAGQSVWGLASELATITGDEPRFTARPGAGRLALSWESAFAPMDLSPVCTLTEKVCTWTYEAAVQTREAMQVAGASWDVGARARGVAVRSETGRVLGRRAALAAVVSEAAALSLVGAAGTEVDVTSASAVVLRARITTELRRWITPRFPIVIRIPWDTRDGRELWPLCTVGALLRVRFDDDYGPFGDAIVRIQTAAFQLGSGRVAELGCELWEAL